MKKFLKFYECLDGHYVVHNHKGAGLGCLEQKGKVFKKLPVLTSVSEDVELTSECLRQIADKLDEMKGIKVEKITIGSEWKDVVDTSIGRTPFKVMGIVDKWVVIRRKGAIPTIANVKDFGPDKLYVSVD